MQLIILESQRESHLGRNVKKLALYSGAEATKCSLFSGISEFERIEAIFNAGESALFTSVSSIQEMGSRLRNCCFGKETVSAQHRVLVVYGFDGSPMESVFLNQLTQGSVVRTERSNGSNVVCRVDARSRDLCGPLSGIDVPLSVSEGESLSTFELQDNTSAVRVIMSLGEAPFFVFLKIGITDIFLLGVTRVPDLDEAPPKTASVLTHFTSLSPIIVCIRYVLKEACWVNDSPMACLIVDDPLLRMNYGYLNYKALLEVMQQVRMCASLAFIPWNYRRTSKAVAELFLSHPERYSLSTHGCDHSGAEFGSADDTLLRYKTAKALERMYIHQQLSGIPFDEIMVFPQGIFSTTAMKALKSCGYLAAVNSTPYPVDAADNALMLRELLDVAVKRFSDLPLFVRRYPKNLAELAFDLFMGKPALIVEHHSYFRNAYVALTEFVYKLNSLEEQLEWNSLSEICSRSCLKRVAENGDIHVKFYTDRFRLQNETDIPQNYRLFMNIASDALLTRVSINGRYADFERKNDIIIIPVTLRERQSSEIILQRGKFDETPQSFRQSWIYDTRVFFRRILSEFRDNYLSKNEFLMRVLQKLKSALSIT